MSSVIPLGKSTANPHLASLDLVFLLLPLLTFLCALTTVNHSHEYDCMLSPVHSPTNYATSWALRITADGDGSHEIKRRLLFGKKKKKKNFEKPRQHIKK